MARRGLQNLYASVRSRPAPPKFFNSLRNIQNSLGPHCANDGDYNDLLALLGRSAEESSFDDSFDPEKIEGDANPQSEGLNPAEAALLADKSGNAIRFPCVSNQINRKLARWAFRTFTSGGLRLPAFALVDDGVLFEREGKILSASDWIPENTAITSLTSEQSL